MERCLIWIAFAVGCAGWLAGLLVARLRQVKTPWFTVRRSHVILACTIPLIVFAATLPGRPPFTEGHGMGMGFLLGGIAALISALISLKIVGARVSSQMTTLATAVGAYTALSAVSISLIYLRPEILDVLCGIALAWAVVTITLSAGIEVSPDTQRPQEAPSPSHVLFTSLLFVTALTAAEILGLYRNSAALGKETWLGAVSTIAIAIPTATLLCDLPARGIAALALRLPLAGRICSMARSVITSDETRQSLARGYRLALGYAVLWGVARMVAVKILDDTRITQVIEVGLLSGMLVWWVTSNRVKDENDASVSETMYPREAILFLLLGAAYILAFNRLMGFGVSLLALSMWPVMALALAQKPGKASASPDRTPELLIRATAVVVILALYRVYYSRYLNRYDRDDIESHFALFGILVGAIYPACLSAFMARAYQPAAGEVARLARLVLLGLFTLAVPCLIIMVWDSSCILGMLTGLALAPVIARYGNSRATQVSASLIAVAGALAITQWTGLAMALSELTRMEKIHLIEGFCFCASVALLVADYGARGKLRAHGTSDGPAATRGGADR